MPEAADTTASVNANVSVPAPRPSPPKRARSIMGFLWGGSEQPPSPEKPKPQGNEIDVSKTKPRDMVQRTMSQPSQVPMGPGGSMGSKMGAGMPRLSPQEVENMRASVIGSCQHVLSTAVTALFQVIKTTQEYIDTKEMADPNAMRQAKLMYVTLLEKVQKERGEWQGFAAETKKQSGDEDAAPAEATALDVLKASLEGLAKEDMFAMLNELVEVSLRNLRGPLVSPTTYGKHKSALAALSMTATPPTDALSAVSEMMAALDKDEKRCLLRLLCLWHAMTEVDSEHMDLRRIIEDKHAQIFNESSGMEYMTGRKAARQDPLAMGLLELIVQHRDVVFSGAEYVQIHKDFAFECVRKEVEIVGTTNQDSRVTPVDTSALSNTTDIAEAVCPTPMPADVPTTDASSPSQHDAPLSLTPITTDTPDAAPAAVTPTSVAPAAVTPTALAPSTAATTSDTPADACVATKQTLVRDPNPPQENASTADTTAATSEAVTDPSPRTNMDHFPCEPPAASTTEQQDTSASTTATDAMLAQKLAAADATQVAMPLMTVSMIAATICTLATMAFFAWRKHR